MCTYTTHIRVCGRCACEDTVLISEQLCIVAKANSGIFGSCLEGILCLRDATRYQCWQCKDRPVVTTVAGVGGRKRRVRPSGRGSTGVNGNMRWF